jgi:hypothetical protein
VWQLEYICADNLPRLAWCAVLSKNESTVVVQHGPWIATTDRGFVEGAWSGPYSEMAFPQASTFTGSGGLVTPTGLLLATPTNSVEALYVLRSGAKLYCSNSLPFVLASADDELDRGYPYYDLDLTSMAFGLARCCRRIPTRGHNWVQLYHYCNCVINQDLSVRRLQKRQLGPFRNYADYRGALAQQVALTLRNSNHPQRAIRYPALATISTGYDSAAAAVLAEEAGCTEAITFATARDTADAEQDDSGKMIGEILGLAVTEHDPLSYRSSDELPEAEFVATGGGGGSVIFTAAEGCLSGKLLLTGNYGDGAWERIGNKGGTGMVSFDSAGADLAQFRLRVGFLHLPVGSIGYSAYTSIRAITHSTEMRPWSLKREQYDRPIPRRIVEEAGVPRELFGQRKKAAVRSLKYCNPYPMMDPDLEQVMAPVSYQHFQRWAHDEKLYRSHLDRLTVAAIHAMYRLNFRVIQNRRLRAAARHLGIRVPAAPWLPLRFRKRRTVHRLLFHWGMEQVRPRYLVGPAQNAPEDGSVQLAVGSRRATRHWR